MGAAGRLHVTFFPCVGNHSGPNVITSEINLRLQTPLKCVFYIEIAMQMFFYRLPFSFASFQSSWIFSRCLWLHWETGSMRVYTSSHTLIPFRRRSSIHSTIQTPTSCWGPPLVPAKPSLRKWPCSGSSTSTPPPRSEPLPSVRV